MSSSTRKRSPPVDTEESENDRSSGSEKGNSSDSDQEELGRNMVLGASSSSSSSKKKRTRGRKGRKAAKKSDRAQFTRADAEEAFGDMEGRRIGDKCKEKYKGMMKQMSEFGATHYSELMGAGESLPCPIPTPIVKGFFGTLTKVGNDRDMLRGVEDLHNGVEYPVPLSHSHVRTHGSAVKDFYRQHRKTVVNEEVQMCKCSMQVFIGTNGKDRFGNLLHVMLAALDPTQLATLGCQIDDVGLHSARKGSASHCLGQPGGPNICAVFLRMNHSLGALRDRYIHEGEGADALCGRMVVGLDFNSISFAVLPPHFNTATSALLTDEFWRTILPNFDSLPTPFKSCLPYLLASVLYHEDFLRSKFPAAHSLWSAPVFANNPMYDQLKRGLLLGVGYCEDTHMSATGIPPHLAIAKQVNDMIEQFKGCRKEIDELKQLITGDLPRLVGDYIRGNFHVEGDALNVGDLDRRDAGLKTYILELINGLKASNQAVLDSHAQQRQGSGHAGHVQGSHDWWKTWDLDGLGNARYTPLQFQFPFALAAATMWRLWLFGNRGMGIRPYRMLRPHCDLAIADRVKFSRAKGIMEFLLKLVGENKAAYLPQGIDNMNLLTDNQCDAVFDKVFRFLHSEGGFFQQAIRTDELPTRAKELCYGTMYNDKCKYETNKGLRQKRSRKNVVVAAGVLG